MALMIFPYRFCPTCGALLDVPEEGDIKQVCVVCDTAYYHNAKPCAGAFVVQDGNVMLVRRGIEPFKGHWDIPGGFLGPDEHPEDGAVREVQEETGLQVRVTDLVGIFVDVYGEGASEHTLNVYYRAEVVGGEPEPCTDAVEIGWFAPDELPEDIAFEHAREALSQWAVFEQRADSVQLNTGSETQIQQGG